MGHPKKPKKKYETPAHPWQAQRIEREKIITKNYGLKRKNEIWKMESFLRKSKQQAKNLIARNDPQSKKEEKLLLNKLYNLGLIEKDNKIESVLDLSTENIMNRRLQTLVFKNNLTRTINQARQLIVHRHITVASKKIDVPSYLVKRNEQDKIQFAVNSKFNSTEHPERIVVKKEKSLEVKPIKKQVGRVEKKRVEAPTETLIEVPA